MIDCLTPPLPAPCQVTCPNHQANGDQGLICHNPDPVVVGGLQAGGIICPDSRCRKYFSPCVTSLCCKKNFGLGNFIHPFSHLDIQIHGYCCLSIISDQSAHSSLTSKRHFRPHNCRSLDWRDWLLNNLCYQAVEVVPKKVAHNCMFLQGSQLVILYTNGCMICLSS